MGIKNLSKPRERERGKRVGLLFPFQFAKAEKSELCFWQKLPKALVKARRVTGIVSHISKGIDP